MPLLFYGPGGGGGGNGYKYPLGNVMHPYVGRNGVSGRIELKWQDPPNININGVNEEWKGTVIVVNNDHMPEYIGDGETVHESVEKDSFKDSPLTLESEEWGEGCFVGIFPYTKNYVVNTGRENVFYCNSKDYMGSLSSSSWKDIIWVASQGKAQDAWNLGDEAVLALKGEHYNLDVNMQVVGFNHDDLVGGGKANVTFFSKGIFDSGQAYGSGNSGPNRNLVTGFRTQNEFFNRVISCMPQIVRDNMKNIYKKRIGYYGTLSAPAVENFSVNIFSPSSVEIGCGQISSTSGGAYEGSVYSFFENGGNDARKRDGLLNKTASWWTQSGSKAHLSGSNVQDVYWVNENGALQTTFGNLGSYSNAKGFVFGFCI